MNQFNLSNRSISTQGRFPRSLNEAFPDTAEYGAAIKIYSNERKTVKDYWLYVVLTFLAALSFGVIVHYS